MIHAMIFWLPERRVVLSVGLTYGYNYGEAITLSEPDVVFDRFKDLLPALGLSYSEHQELEK